jgi:hypothetical protein
VPTDRMTQGRRGVSKLEDRIERLSTRYLRAESILTSLVTRTVLAGTLGQAKVRRATRAQAKVMLEELDKAGIPEGAAIVEDAYRLGIRLAAKETEVLGAIDKQALALIQSNLKERLGAATTHVGRRVDDVFRKEALRLAAANLGDQEIPASDILQRRLVKQGITAFTDRKGRLWGLETYARMAVKTTTAEAVFHGTQTTMIGAGLDLVDVNSVTKPCHDCKKYDGKTFSLSGASRDYPFLDTVFPVHPECQHYIVVSRFNFEGRAAA